MKQNFVGKTVLITGASAGIGAALSVELAKQKANLVLNARNRENLEETKKLCMLNGCTNEQVVLVCGDISVESIQTELVDSALKAFGKIDVLVNNAGTTHSIRLLRLKMNEFDDILNLNLRVPVALSLLALPHLIKTKGNIINISSLASTRPIAGRISYNTSKAALDMFTKSLAFNVAKFGVRVNSVNPAVVPTSFGRYDNVDADAKAKIKNAVLALHPLGRIGKVEEVTNAILFLASDEASFTTGQIFNVDGGAAICGLNSTLQTPPSKL